MLWVKSLHILSVIAWMAALLYLPRLLVYHAESTAGSEKSETFKVMERRLLRAIVDDDFKTVLRRRLHGAEADPRKERGRRRQDGDQPFAGQPLQPFRYFDKGNLATIGRARAIAEIGRLKLTGLAAWLAWLFVHILYLIGFRNRAVVILNWAWAYVRLQRGARLIYGDVTNLVRPERKLEDEPSAEMANRH